MFRIFYLLLLVIVCVCNAFSAHIKGNVLDVNSEMLIGVIVQIKETGQGTTSNLDGSFHFRNIAAGTYTVTCSYLGYAAQAKTVTIDQEAHTVNLDFVLNESANELGEVVVEGEQDRESDENARNKEKNADNVMNVVSARAIQLSPDITVANVVQRVSGISIERNSNGDGQYAIVRGMDKRYSYTLVNGVKIPSPDNKYRYVPLDIFPAEMLDRLEVTKSLTPSQEGDAIGGAVNLVMKDAPNKRYISASVSTGFSELYTKRDYLAYDFKNSNKQSPYELKGKYYDAKISDFPTNTVDYQSKTPSPNLLGGFAIGDRFFKQKLGAVVAASYQNTYRGSNSVFFNAENVDTDKYVTLTKENERQYSEQQKRYGVHLKTDYKFNPRHKLQWYNVYMNLTNIQTRDMKTTDFSAGYDPELGNAKLNYTTRSRLTIQKIMNSTLQGEHKLSEKLKAQWSTVFSLATNEVPDNTQINLRGESVNFVERKTTVDDMSRRWEHNSDKDFSAYLNLTYRSKIIGKEIEWMA